MALVNVLNDKTEAEIVATLKAAQAAIAQLTATMKRVERVVDRIDCMVDAVSKAGV